MSFDTLVNGIELLVLIYLLVKSKGWDGPALRSSIDVLFRDFGFIKHTFETHKTRLESLNRESRDHSDKLKELENDLKTLGTEVNKINHGKV